MLMIAAEELDMDMSQMRFVRLDTNVSPDQGETSGSNGTRNQGAQVRTAVVAARSALLDLAAASLGVAKGSLTVDKGVVTGGGKSVTYGDLLGDKLFNVQIPVGAPTTSFNPTQPGATSIDAGGTGAKPISQYKLVGTLVPRIDIPDIVTGKYTYIQNIRIPGMLHGRVIRPRGQGAFGLGTDTPILSVDESSIKHLPNVQIVRVRNFLGVVAPLEYDAIQAAAQLKVTWADPPALPSSGNLWKQMRDQDSQGLVQDERGLLHRDDPRPSDHGRQRRQRTCVGREGAGAHLHVRPAGHRTDRTNVLGGRGHAERRGHLLERGL